MGFFEKFSDFFNFINDPLGILPEDVYKVLFDPAGIFQPIEQPDIGAPDTQQLSIVTAKEGDVIPELLGISKLPGNIIHYWGNRNTEVKEEQEQGGKGGSSTTVITGYKYYLSWLQAICLGETDYLYAVYKGDNIVWAGELERPVSGGMETITLTDYSDDAGNGVSLGNMTFYFGTDDQAANSSIPGGTLNVPYRNLCYAFFDDVLLGQANQVPVFSFILAKRPTISFNTNKTINIYDYNPAHAIWWILEQMTDLPTSFLDETSFSTVANTLSTEQFGISILFNNTSSANDYIDNILLHINGIKYYDTDGKLKLKLLRKDEDVSNMLSLSDDDFIQTPTLKRGSWMETSNEIHGIYPQRILTEPVSSTIELLFGSGANSSGQLGIGDNINRSGFTLITEGRYTKVAAGASHSAVIKSDGTLWTTGSNFYGQLGQGDNDNLNTLTQVGSDSNWAEVACTNHGTIAIKTNGTIWGTGLNSNGELGLGDNTNRNSFEQAGTDSNWFKIAAGNQHVIALKSDGSMYGTGDNGEGQLGQGDTNDLNEFTLIDSNNWIEIACGSTHTLAIKNDNTFYGCGTAFQGQLGIGTTAKETSLIQLVSGSWSKIAGGQWHSLAIKTDGTLYTTGDNGEGQLGQGDNNPLNAWTQIGSDSNWAKCFTMYNTTLVVKSTGIAWGCGYVYPDIFGTGNISDNELNLVAIGDTDAWETFTTQSNGHFLGIKQ